MASENFHDFCKLDRCYLAIWHLALGIGLTLILFLQILQKKSARVQTDQMVANQ